MRETQTLISATGLDGNCIIAFDAKAFAKTCAEAAAELHKIHPELAKLYLQAMGGLSIKMEGCTATNDHSHKGLSD
jgi:hypothetical protein